MIFNHLKVLKSCSLSTQSLASCVNYFVWNCFTCFSNTKIGSVTSFFDIVQFSRSCAPQPCGWRLDYFTTEAVFCQALFFRGFWTFWTWMLQSFSVLTGTFQRLLVLFKGFVPRLQKSFFCLSAWRSSIIPHLPPSVNTFLQVFLSFLQSIQVCGNRHDLNALRFALGIFNSAILGKAVMTGSRCGPVPDFPI